MEIATAWSYEGAELGLGGSMGFHYLLGSICQVGSIAKVMCLKSVCVGGSVEHTAGCHI